MEWAAPRGGGWGAAVSEPAGEEEQARSSNSSAAVHRRCSRFAGNATDHAAAQAEIGKLAVPESVEFADGEAIEAAASAGIGEAGKPVGKACSEAGTGMCKVENGHGCHLSKLWIKATPSSVVSKMGQMLRMHNDRNGM